MELSWPPLQRRDWVQRAEGFRASQGTRRAGPRLSQVAWRGACPGLVRRQAQQHGRQPRWSTLLLPCQSVPEVDPATPAPAPKPQLQQRTRAGSCSSSPAAPYSTAQGPALSVTGPITANSEQVLAFFPDTGRPEDCPSSPSKTLGGLPGPGTLLGVSHTHMEDPSHLC